MEKYRLPDDKRAQMERSPVPFAVYRFVDKRVETLVLSDGFRELFGCADREEAFYDTDDLMYTGAHPDDAARVADAALKFIVNGVPYNVVYRFRKPGTNTYRVIHATGKHVCLDNGDGAAYVWYIDEGDYTGEDVFEESGFNAAVSRALLEESVIKASSCDYLTGLPSMSHFFELAEENKKTVAARGGVPVMIYFDLCGMKFYNGKHGFSEGDKVIRAFGRLLASRFAEKNCSRFGSDRFAVCTESLGIENKLRDIFDEWSSQGREYPMIRAGIYDTSFDDADAGTACDRAKIACDAQKNIRRSTFGYFNKELLENIRRRRYIIDNIDKAISEDRIQVYYQPIVRAVNGKVCDEEALARWIDPEKGTMSPGEFIPVLEEEGLIYKLDLCVIEKVLSKLKTQEREGLHLVPQSVNLSRSDFEMCDIVGEICRRVDAAGVGRDKLTIEITESMLGSDTEFMKEQIQRFQSLGFSVWMDDFGKGYSSLDTLQSVKFQLIKFDMSFMQNFNNGESGKIILTELVKMATSLGMDTVCEGVETEEQVRFLREIGCSKLQGFFYLKPIPLEKLIDRYRRGIQIGFEDPKESSYFEAIGRVNLHDLAVLTEENDNSLNNYFDTIPMAIIEVVDDDVRLVRSNHTYRRFLWARFGFNISSNPADYGRCVYGSNSNFMSIIRQCCRTGERAFFDETLQDGATAHYFAKRLSVNNKTKASAVAVGVLSIIDSDQGTTYANIARALASDYFNLFYVDLETEDFIEYTSGNGNDSLAIERHGKSFFDQARKDAYRLLYRDDVEHFLEAFTKESVVKVIDEQGVYQLTYRQIKDEEPTYVIMKAMRMIKGGRYIIIGVSNINAQMKKKELLDAIRDEKIAYSRLMALSTNYICLYTVDLETDKYIEYQSTVGYKGLGLAQEGEDFFNKSAQDGKSVVFRDDLTNYLHRFTKDNVLSDIKNRGRFELRYRLKINEIAIPVEMRVVEVNEAGVNKLIVGVSRTQEYDEY